MLKNYRSYMEYKELRRRIEANLSKPRHVLIHAFLFMVANVAIWYVTFRTVGNAFMQASVHAPGIITTFWSFGLLAHALWGLFHSGLWPNSREKAIETEMVALLEDAGHNLDDEEYFAIHQMLREDVQQRAGYQFSLGMFAISNTLVWLLWLSTIGSLYGTPLWYPAIFAAFVFLLCGGILNVWRSVQREQQRMQNRVSEKREKQQVNETRYFATPEHGRLEIMEDDLPVFEKRKRL
jgi:hypothetical protein